MYIQDVLKVIFAEIIHVFQQNTTLFAVSQKQHVTLWSYSTCSNCCLLCSLQISYLQSAVNASESNHTSTSLAQ